MLLAARTGTRTSGRAAAALLLLALPIFGAQTQLSLVEEALRLRSEAATLLETLHEQQAPATDAGQQQCGALPPTALTTRPQMYEGANGFTGELDADAVERALLPFRPHRAIFDTFVCKLLRAEPVSVWVFGGSITNGVGLRDLTGGAAPPHWPNQLEAWLEDAFPVDVNIVKTHRFNNRSHTVHDASKSATNSCFLARAMRGLIASFGLLPDAKPDLVLLEYGAFPVRTEGQPLSRSTWEPGDHDVMLKQPSLARRGTPPPLFIDYLYHLPPRAPLFLRAARTARARTARARTCTLLLMLIHTNTNRHQRLPA